MSNFLEAFAYAGGAFALLLFFQWLGTPLVWRLFRATDIVRLPLARFAVGYGVVATATTLLLWLGVTIRIATLLVVIAMVGDVFWCMRRKAFRRWLWLSSFSVRRDYWLPAFFALMLGILFTSPRFQIAHHGWMHISTERNIAWGLWPDINPGLVLSTVERPMGGSIVLAALSNLTGLDVMPLLCAWRICVVLSLVSVGGTFCRAFGLPRRLRAHLPGLYITMTVLTPMIVWLAWCFKATPEVADGITEGADSAAIVRGRLLSAFNSKDVLRDIWSKFSPDHIAGLTDCLDKIISGEYLLPGTAFAGLALAGALFLRRATARLFLVGICVWTVGLVYTLQVFPAGIAAVLLILRSLPELRAGFANGSWRTWLGLFAFGAVCMSVLLIGKYIQSPASAVAAIEHYGGTPPRITLAPHIPNVITPLGLFWIPLLFGWPLVQLRAPRWRRRLYFVALGILLFCTLFVRMPGGWSYKWSFLLPFFALPPLGALLLLIQRSARPHLVSALHYALLIYMPFTLDIVLRLRSDWFRAPILEQLDLKWDPNQATDHARYVATILPALDWIRDHTPRDTYVLYHPDRPGCGAAASNFAPIYHTRRRFVYVEDPIYVKPMPLANSVRQAVEAVYSGSPEQRDSALRQIAGYGLVFVISAPPWRIGDTATTGKLVFEQGEVRVFELPAVTAD